MEDLPDLKKVKLIVMTLMMPKIQELLVIRYGTVQFKTLNSHRYFFADDSISFFIIYVYFNPSTGISNFIVWLFLDMIQLIARCSRTS